MTRFATIFALSLSLTLACGAARAENWFTDFFAGCQRDYARNRAWPEPFPCSDAESVHAPFAVMAANGWQRYNLLGEPHFNDEEKAITAAGLALVQRVVNESQPENRVLFVARGATHEITAARISLVQKVAAGYADPGETVMVVPSRMQVEGNDAEISFAIRTGRLKTIPEPKLPAAAAGAEAGGSK